MALNKVAVDRRTLLIGGGAGIGLVVAFMAWPRREGSPLRPASREGVFGPYLRISTDDKMTLAVPQAEVGQGIWTGLAQIAGDELGAAWDRIAVEPAPHAPAYVNQLVARDVGVSTRVTAGGTSIRAFEQPLREAAAIAREMLCMAAAARWGVNAAECDTADGAVIHEGKRLPFGQVSADAAGLAPPTGATLRPIGSGKLSGQSLPRLDGGPKSDGSLRFAGDVRLPRTLFASARLAPPGGRVVGFGADEARKQAGLVRLVERKGWIAAVAQSWWAADRALDRGSARFAGPTGADGATIDARLGELLETGTATRAFERGDYSAAVEGSRPLAATYSVAPLPHRSLEAPSVVARFTGDRLEIWAGTQVPDLVRSAAASASGIGEREVTVYAMPIGDPSGRGVEVEAVAIAVDLAKAVGRPICLTLPPDGAQNHDAARPPLAARVAALPAPDGTIAAWSARLVGMAGLEASLARGGNQPIPPFAPRNVAPPYGIPAVRIDAVDAGLPIRTGYWRGGSDTLTTFVTESFIDEMARALGAEPLAYRIGMLGGSPRLARAITTAAAIGGWDGGGRGSSLGLACASLQGSHIGLMVEASIGADQRISVSRMTAAVDVGRAINPALVRQQVEGGLLAALAAATVPAPDFVAGMPRATPMRGQGFERLSAVPKVEVEVIASRDAPGGVSGLGMAVLAPAVANAIAAATGRRLRRLPFDPMASA
ncbi:molybdopterin cofactor-binding domain-containing protein [Sphingomonas sp. LY160]|uniref:molybdopterin cofactor-binding domain-containing protein n=1 Tax=Sphingomonas sp. LY160 TaxID=3095342 RepID=UPI002ADEED4E|nr:molybdopterin cofactor-binding domain-containing protein [Sphingomonas sp. LY160]MEA1072164.1 molybdopterin cofactor-binding domain-containing protein [Sphingomonas sp. LY160]